MHAGTMVAGRFAILGRAGSGAMGIVYRATDGMTGAPVALKVLQGHGDESAARFEREASVLAGLHDPGIVRYVAHGSLGRDTAYLAMEWLHGETLAARLERGVLEVEDAIAVGYQIASAVARAHALGVVHRDLKPANIFLRGRSTRDVVVLDFGIARLVFTGKTMTETGTTLGTPGYLPPEQARGERVDARSDVYAISCVIFRALTGRTPHVGESAMALMLSLVTEQAPRLASLRPDAPRALDELLAASLSHDPALRPKDAGALAAALGQIDPAIDLRRAISVAPVADPAPTAGPAPPPTVRDPTVATGPEGSRSHARRLLTIAAVPLLVASGAAGALLLAPDAARRDSKAAPAPAPAPANCPTDLCEKLDIETPESADPFAVLEAAKQFAARHDKTLKLAAVSFTVQNGRLNLSDRETGFTSQFVRPDQLELVTVFVHPAYTEKLLATVDRGGLAPYPITGSLCPPDRVIQAAVANGMPKRERYGFSYAHAVPTPADPEGPIS